MATVDFQMGWEDRIARVLQLHLISSEQNEYLMTIFDGESVWAL
jgi:hypothetical protein